MRQIITAAALITVVAFLKIDDMNGKTNYVVPTNVVKSEPTQLEKFLRHMAARESNGIPHIVNQFGMMGKYQFDPRTVRLLGYKVTQKQFLSDSELQDSVMVAYMRVNNKELNSLITKYEFKTVKGIKITRAGVLAAAHLAGSGNVRLFFQSSDWVGRTDANGTSIREYLKTFSIYRLKHI